jgi:hypothetical protein
MVPAPITPTRLTGSKRGVGRNVVNARGGDAGRVDVFLAPGMGSDMMYLS